jgi:hypothetical protein
VLGQLTRKSDGQTLILHLLNYDHQTAAENVKVRLDLSRLVHDLSRWEVKVLSPDAAQPRIADLSLHGSICEFTLGRIERYTVVTLSARSEPQFYRQPGTLCHCHALLINSLRELPLPLHLIAFSSCCPSRRAKAS